MPRIDRGSIRGVHVVRKTFHKETLANYERESDVLALVKGIPGMAQVVGFSDKRLTIDMLEIQGFNLLLLHRERTEDLRDQLALALKVTDAFMRLHERGIAHMDIKPENIIVSDDDSVTVINFDRSTTERILDEPRGTVHFMAPEMHMDKAYDTFAADRWSLGCVLYELFNGRQAAFPQDCLEDIIADVTSGVPREWSCHEDIRAAVEPLMSMDPTRRPLISDVHEQLVEIFTREAF